MKITILKRNALALVIRIILLLFLVDTLYALLILLFVKITPVPTDFVAIALFLWALHTLKYIFITAVLLRLLVQWLGTLYIMEGKLLTISTGVYAVKEKVYELNRIKSVSVQQDWIGRRFHYGNLTLELGSSGYHEAIELRDIQNPRQFEHMLAGQFV
jgi:membrane protein YdbS with pleckstrin-like domain